MDYNRQPLPHFTRQICYCVDNLQAMAGPTGQTNWSDKKKKKKPQAVSMSKWLIKFPAWMLVFVLKQAGEGTDTSTVLCHDKVVC